MAHNKKILIIDDEGDLNDIIAMRLTKAGYEIDTATNGPLGIEKAKSFKPDIVLLDINMPGMDGWQVCEQLRADPETKNLNIVILTATREFTKAKKFGVKRVVLKPFNYEEILDVIK
ncbi:MAG: response regulator [Deltaproteobacteria bacterium]|nr:response regulator [Deltaproteobacteria bacterium]